MGAKHFNRSKKTWQKKDATPWNIAGTGSPVNSRTRGKRVALAWPPSPDPSICLLVYNSKRGEDPKVTALPVMWR